MLLFFGNHKKQLKHSSSSSSKSFKKVRLKLTTSSSQYFAISVLFYLLSFCVKDAFSNRPPRFLLEGQTEIVLRLKEGPGTPIEAPIYRLKGLDPDGDVLEFGIRNSYDSEILRIENVGMNEADIYLTKELDRETKDEYSVVLTLTDNRLGDGNYVTQSLLLLVEDVNDNEPVFKPFQSAIEVPENSRPGVLTTLEATDRDEGAYGQVVYYLQELDGDNDVFTVSTIQGKGVIKLVKDLDYERKSLYQLKVLAVDRAHQGRVNTATAALLVKIKDIEDQPPEFIVLTPVARVPENAPIGTQVLQVKAIDGDRGVNNRIKYSILRGGEKLFHIDSETGNIFVSGKLDREEMKNQGNGAYILEILATEMSKIRPAPSVQTEVTIVITDINDETPRFRASKYETEIDENAQINTPLTFLGNAKNEVFDYDQGNNGTFDLILDPPTDIFEITPNRVINEANFLIRVKNPELLDYENITQLHFNIIAREIVPNGKQSSVPVTVYIRDRNDNFPEFSQSMYEVHVAENIGVGFTIAHINARDPDSGNYGTKGIRFTGLTGSVADLLSINGVTGVITLKHEGGNAFDREIVARHFLTVEARDDMGHGNRNTAQLIININDVNDNPPIFIQTRYEVRLFENKDNFEIPLKVEAKDADLNGTKNSEISYEIIDGEFKDNFTINSRSGELLPLGLIDFEELSNGAENIRTIQLTIRASDAGSPVLSSKVVVLIYVQDVNDHAPVFQHEIYKKSIPEDLSGGSSILEVVAQDEDGSAPNNAIVYRIVDGASDKFVIGSSSGVISVAQGSKLDPDLTDPKTTEYSLTVMALDGGFGDGQLTATTSVNISIVDINNKPPVFHEPGLIHVKENTPVGTNIYRLLAYDFDEVPVLRYHFDGNTSEARTEEGTILKQSEYDYLSAFELNQADGLIRVVKLLDREKLETIKLGVVVEDIASARDRQIASSTLTILIDDENDNNPKFKKPFYKRTITENSANGVTIANVVAFDIDKNRTITYSLEGPQELTSLVHLDAESGEIVVANRIDHEQFDWMNITVRATDSGVPSRSSLVDVFIQVIDENDNNPYFITEVTNYTVPENSVFGLRIGMIEARDADSGEFGKISFMMDKIGSQGKFSIDPDTGVLSVADQLDRETRDSFMLVIEAWDNYQFGYLTGESRNAFKQIFITVADENDNPPVLKPVKPIQITEYHETDDIVTVLKGTDADDPLTPNGQIQFEIHGGNGMSLFRIDQIDDFTAHIMTQRSLKGYYGNYTLNLVLYDLGEPSNMVEEVLEVHVADFNDHPPVFTSPSHNITIRVPENATIGASIIQVVAKDEDEGPNALVRYRLKIDAMGNYRTFNIDQSTGEITLKLALDRERQKIYELRVEAFDQGIPTPLSSDLDLTIYVRNVNDYEPQFLVEEILVNFTEHSRPGVERIKLPDTVDRDEVDELDDPPSVVCYFIVFGNDDGYFQLDPETHILSLLKELDREKRANYSLIIKASEDCQSPPNNLTLQRPAAQRRISDSRESPLTMRYKSLADKYYSHFDRYKHSRSIRSLEDTDGFMAEYDEYSGTIDFPEDNTLVRVFITVRDINDNPPTFVSKIFTGGVTTSTNFGTEFMQIDASDIDEGANAVIQYYQIGDIQRSLTEGLEHLQKPPFLVDVETGAILLNFDPQKGMKGYFDFMVLANDTDGLQDIAHVFIYLLREDQRVRFVLRQQPPELRDKIQVFRDVLGNVTRAIVNVDEFKVHENKDGSVDKTKTDIYLHFVDQHDNSILEVSDILKIIDLNIEELDTLFKDFNVIDTQPAEAMPLTGAFGTKGPMIVTLIICNLFIGVLLIVVLGLCMSQRTNYKRQLKAARVNSYTANTSDIATRITATRVPNTNKHSMEGSNPIWLKAYANEWFKNDDDVVSRGSGENDSLDENVLASEDMTYHAKSKELNGINTQNNLSRPYNVYQHMDKFTNVQMLQKKLETTEL